MNTHMFTYTTIFIIFFILATLTSPSLGLVTEFPDWTIFYLGIVLFNIFLSVLSAGNQARIIRSQDFFNCAKCNLSPKTLFLSLLIYIFRIGDCHLKIFQNLGWELMNKLCSLAFVRFS